MLRHLVIAAGLLIAFPAYAVTPQQIEFFESRIRPVLAQDCYECHSEAGKKKGGLLLDSRAGWQKGGESGDVIVVGDANKSLLIQAIRHEHEDIKMPKAGAKLDDKVIADFERWINEGAFDPRDQAPSKEQYASDTSWKAVLERRKQWWAFQPVKAVTPPDTNANPVDAFIDARLRDAGLKSAEPADAATILRRLSYIITGLPPTPEAVKSFTIHNLPSTIDTLLASPRYGEKWARHWMDWVRYAETYGSEGDPAIPYAWRYRDYLIRAFNKDVPYPQMVREAVAGDLLQHPRIADGINESALGIAQLRMVLHGFSPTDTLDEMCTFTDNQIDVVSKAFQGLTVSCARCHNHKFEAISQTDFYSWFGIFSSTHPAVIDVNTPDRGKAGRDQMLKLKSQIKGIVAQAWLTAAATLPVQKIDQGNTTFAKSDVIKRFDLRKEKWFADGKGVSQGATKAGEFSIDADGKKVIERIYPSGVFSDLVSTKERAVLISPTFKCEGGTLWMRSCGGGSARARYIVQNYPRTGTIHKAKEFKEPDDAKLGWRKLELDYWKGDDIFIQCTTVADMPAEAKPDERSWFGITDVIITKGTEPPPSAPVGGDPREAVAAWMNDTLTDDEAALLNQLLHDGKLPATVAEAAPLLDEYGKLEAQLPMPTRSPGVLEADARDAHLFIRGDHKQPGEIVPRYFLDAIDPTPFKSANSGRLQLAESIASKGNPLTARVIVNRIWHHVFGRGIVATTDNFGRLGELPTHPELLDYLAQRFIDSGGSIKEMIKLLVSTQAFQRSDRAPGGAVVKDPENKLLSHFSVRRLEAETIRDSILALTGRLDETLYGDSVPGGDMRRSVYVKVLRNNLDDFLTVFDAPVPMSTRGRRDATNVPAQSLTLLNSPRVKDWAVQWGRKTQGTDEERIGRMFAEAFGREPTRDELAGCLSFVQQSSRAADVERAELAKLEAQSKSLRDKIEAVLGPVRAKLGSQTVAVPLSALPESLAEWDFEDGPQDLKGNLPLTLDGNARIDHGALVLDGSGKSFARSKPLQKALKAKTLEAWVMLDTLDQRGGGVLTVQDTHGVVFDSIVFGEKDPQCWVAGSNNFKRTQSLNGPAEQEATKRAVHVAVVYGSNGSITAYRDGQAYGDSYVSNGPATFEAGGSEVLLGCRHGSGGGNKLLHGRVLRARLYDRALKPDEIALSRKAEGASVSERDVLGKLTDAQRADVSAWQQQLRALTGKTSSLREQAARLEGADQTWGSLALSLINLKEFIYLK